MHEFEKFINRWKLTPDGEPLTTSTSRLLPVRYKNMPAMLKIAKAPEEQASGQLMLWWDGEGAARILTHDHDNYAILIERATGTRSLARMAKKEQDDEATRIICKVVNTLHVPKNKPLPPTLVPLSIWFKSLESAKTKHRR